MTVVTKTRTLALSTIAASEVCNVSLDSFKLQRLKARRHERNELQPIGKLDLIPVMCRNATVAHLISVENLNLLN